MKKNLILPMSLSILCCLYSESLAVDGITLRPYKTIKESGQPIESIRSKSATGRRPTYDKKVNIDESPSLTPEVELGEEGLAEQPKPDLKTLTLASTLKILTGNVNQNYTPIIEGTGTLGARKLGGGYLAGDLTLSLKPDYASGSAKDLAQQIRVDTGTIDVNVGISYLYLWKEYIDENGPQGFEIRAAGQLSYQHAATNSTNASSTSTETVSNDFGIVNPEIRAGLWLKYLYVGYKFAYDLTFGNKSDLSNEIDRSSIHKILGVMKIKQLSGETVDDSTKDPFYLELGYTGGKNSFNNGTFSMTFTKAWDSAW